MTTGPQRADVAADASGRRPGDDHDATGTGPLPVVRRLVGDVQRFGLLSAATVVDRYVDAVDRTMLRASSGAGSAPPSPPAPGSRPSLDSDTSALAASAARLAQVYVDAFASAAQLVSPAPPAQAPVALGPVRAGGRAEASVWLHNPTPQPLPAGVPAATSWLAADGASLAASTVSFDPTLLPPVPPGASVEVRVTVVVPAHQPPGTYHGLLVVPAAPDGPLPVIVRVTTDRDPA